MQVVDVELQVGDHHTVGVVVEEAVVAEWAVVQRAAALEHVISVVNQVTLAMPVPTRMASGQTSVLSSIHTLSCGGALTPGSP